MTKKRASWYNLLPWWGLIIAIMAIGLVGSLISTNFTGFIPDLLDGVLGVVAFYCLLALAVTIIVSIYRLILRLLPKRAKPIAKQQVRDESKELLDFRE